jgi:hypothetical protein
MRRLSVPEVALEVNCGCKVPGVRLVALLLLAFPAAAASLKDGTPALQLRIDASGGQPSTLLGPRPGLGVGLAYQLTDQLSVIADTATRAAPGGGIISFAAGLSATLDITPVTPYLELAVVTLTNRAALGYSLATRTGVGVDYKLTRNFGLGVVVRTYAAFDPQNNDNTLAGFEAALRFVFIPGAK